MSDDRKLSRIIDDVRRDVLHSISHLGREWTEEETRSVSELILKMVEIMTIGRMWGLISVEDCVQDIPESADGAEGLLKLAVTEIVEANTIQWVEEDMTTVYWLDSPSGIEALKYYIVITGIELLYSLANSNDCIRRLTLLVPVKYRKDLTEKCVVKTQAIRDNLEKEEAKRYAENREIYHGRVMEDEKVNMNNLEELEKMILKADDKRIRDMIVYVPFRHLGNVLPGLSIALQDRIGSLTNENVMVSIMAFAEKEFKKNGDVTEYKHPERMNASVVAILEWFEENMA
ncbi:MAG: hypothetical protein K6G03_04265 [Lachnospiraceae bacterium]|nr:hypothetical protein [Lachnospiraceae bacterium]